MHLSGDYYAYGVHPELLAYFNDTENFEPRTKCLQLMYSVLRTEYKTPKFAPYFVCFEVVRPEYSVLRAWTKYGVNKLMRFLYEHTTISKDRSVNSPQYRVTGSLE